jgi:hypothetical protein
MPAPKVTPDTIGRVAEEIVRVPVAEKDRKAVADLLHSLMGDMAALDALDVGETEPALIYRPNGTSASRQCRRGAVFGAHPTLTPL